MLELKKTHNLNQPYVVSSNKIYAIGAQNGTFPKMGTHVPGEMGGIITQPIKILDGYRARIISDGHIIELSEAQSFTMKENQAEFFYETEGIKVWRKEQCFYDERIMEVAYRVESRKDITLEVEFDIHIMGCWTREYVQKECESIVIYESDKNGFVYKNTSEPWFAGVFSTTAQNVTKEGGTGNIGKFSESQVQKKDEVAFYILSSTSSAREIIDQFSQITVKRQSMMETNRERIDRILSCSQLSTNEPVFDQTFEWMKINYEMLVQKIEGIGEGYTAGYPEYPWFFGCDTFFGIHGTLAAGQHEMSKKTIELLYEISKVSNKDSGRVIHELSPFQIVYNYGNTQETPHFIIAVWETFSWTGDMVFLKKLYPYCQKGMKWLREEKMEPSTHLPIGYGITEVEGLDTRVVDSAVITYSAYKAMAKICNVMGEQSEADAYTEWAKELKTSINTYFFMEDPCMFADAVFTREELEERKNDMIHSSKNTESQVEYLKSYINGLLATEESELIQVLMKNSIVLTPLLEDILPEDLSKKAVEAILKDSFINEYGLKLSGMPSKDSDKGDDLYSMNKAMSMGTGKLVKILAKHGMADKAWEIMMNMVNTIMEGMPGTISEVLPDTGCFMQFWSGYGVHYAFVSEILGIQPDAYRKTIVIKPNLPKALTFVTLKNLKVGMDTFSFSFTKEKGVTKVEVLQTCPDYTIICE